MAAVATCRVESTQLVDGAEAQPEPVPSGVRAVRLYSAEVKRSQAKGPSSSRRPASCLRLDEPGRDQVLFLLNPSAVSTATARHSGDAPAYVVEPGAARRDVCGPRAGMASGFSLPAARFPPRCAPPDARLASSNWLAVDGARRLPKLAVIVTAVGRRSPRQCDRLRAKRTLALSSLLTVRSFRPPCSAPAAVGELLRLFARPDHGQRSGVEDVDARGSAPAGSRG